MKRYSSATELRVDLGGVVTVEFLGRLLVPGDKGNGERGLVPFDRLGSRGGGDAVRVRAIRSHLEREGKPAGSSAKELAEWLACSDVKEFLAESTAGDVPLYLSTATFYLYSVFVAEESLKGKYVEDLMAWNFEPSSGWGYGWETTDSGPLKAVYPPLDHTYSRILDGGAPVFFLRYFEGVRSYVEIDQRLAHVLCVHWMDDRQAYCTIDENGDFFDVAVARRDSDSVICTLDRKELDFYLFLTDSVLVRVFDVSRSLDWGAVHNRRRQTERHSDPKGEMYADHTVVRDEAGLGVAAWLRGFQLIRREMNEREATKRLMGEQDRQYETFIAYDFKHQIVCECSCDPSLLGNYFVESDLPFQTSPAFFRPEVLLKYKQHPDKYHVREGGINCRGGWSLRYHINEEGQVHAYLCDLGRLPHGEQVYWKSFNERPKAGISERAFKTDFLAEWDDSYDPLVSLRQCLDQFPQAVLEGTEVSIWLADNECLRRLTYVVTDSRKEWEDQILVLAKLLIEGLRLPALSNVASRLGCHDESLGSVRLLEACLKNAGVAPEVTDSAVTPLLELWNTRSQAGVAHRGRSAAPADTKGDFARLLGDLDSAMRTLADLIRAGYLNGDTT